MDNKMVSVIIPCYNNELTIARAITSVLSQTYEEREIIVVDDGSTDDSKAVIQSFARENPSIKYIKQENAGPSAARNTGARAAKGRYLAFLDADDEWLPHKLQLQVHTLEKCNGDLLGCNYYIVSKDGKTRHYFVDTDLQHISFRRLLFRHYFSTSCVLIKKELYHKLGGFNENQRYMEDSLLFTNMARAGMAYMSKDFLVNIYKQPFGESGLSGNLYQMEKFELLNFTIFKDENHKYQQKLSSFVYIGAIVFSLVKFIRRLMKVWIRNTFRK